jgi:Protein of unknown function (DUF1549)/Protein of unknown function (DUF1553)
MPAPATWFRFLSGGLLALSGLLATTPPVTAQSSSGKQTPDPLALARAIDTAIDKRLSEGKVPPSPLTTDAEFLRRIYLDIAGVVPAWDHAAAFLDSKAAEKRTGLVEKLLASPEHARMMADVWKELLIPKTAAAMRRDQIPLARWLERSFAENKPWDRLFHELLTASGMQDENPATTFYIVHESVDEVTDRVSRVLLGVQLQCAQCHDHPFADWKRDEYWGLARFFTKVGPRYERIPKRGERYGAGENGKKTLLRPASARMVPARFLRGKQPDLDPNKPYLPVLADWLTAPDNPYFARAMVNRLWAHFFGRGLVDPVDRMHADNPATHPELLDLLTREFVASGFDGRFLIRAICLSKTYQRSCRPLAANKADQKLYSHMPVRVIQPFPLHDSLERVWAGGKEIRAPPPTDPKAEKRFHGSRNGAAAFFAAEEGSSPTEYRAGIPQALSLMNTKDTIYRLFRATRDTLREAKSPQETITRLYLMTVSRRPRPAELDRLTRFIKEQGSKPDVYGDILWALLNSTEFFTNH